MAWSSCMRASRASCTELPNCRERTPPQTASSPKLSRTQVGGPQSSAAQAAWRHQRLACAALSLTRNSGPARRLSVRPDIRSRIMIDDLWYKNGIIYCLSVGTYMDANGDGVGDFKGLLRRLDYLHGLGITAIWLMPFQPSPGKDSGYDISDYYG